MKRIKISPRENYQEKLKNIGFNFYSDYWLEDAYYEFNSEEIDQIELASNRIYEMYCTAIQFLLCHDCDDPIWKHFDFTPKIIKKIKESWDNDDLSLYGRFDFIYQDGKIKLLEFNADTPTSLIEASIVQWNWKEEVFPDKDQFNLIHENLVSSWESFKELYTEVGFTCDFNNEEDLSTTSYLCSTAAEAGMNTSMFDICDMQTDGKYYCTPDGSQLELCFKLYPWEWMFDEQPDDLSKTDTKFIEPFWKSLMSNKYILVILSQLFPNSPYILKTTLEPQSDSYCKKPIYSREGANITLVKDNKIIEQTNGDYDSGDYIYQELIDHKSYDGKYPIIGSWIIGGQSSGIGIRENSQRITDNISHFVPHIIA